MTDPVTTDDLRALLRDVAHRREMIRYQEAALRLGLRPPGTIQAVAGLLEALMAEDAARGDPFIAALVVSRSGEALPARGFFETALRLGRYAGEPDDAAARDFHAAECAAAWAFHGARDCPEP